MKSLGNHLLIEFYDCDHSLINQVDKVEAALVESVNISGATLIKSCFHQFNPHGVSGVVVIAESHFTIHTWPEFGYCAVDIFTCGDKINSIAALNYLKEVFDSNSMSIVEMKRGILNIPPEKLKHKPDSLLLEVPD